MEGGFMWKFWQLHRPILHLSSSDCCLKVLNWSSKCCISSFSLSSCYIDYLVYNVIWLWFKPWSPGGPTDNLEGPSPCWVTLGYATVCVPTIQTWFLHFQFDGHYYSVQQPCESYVQSSKQSRCVEIDELHDGIHKQVTVLNLISQSTHTPRNLFHPHTRVTSSNSGWIRNELYTRLTFKLYIS